MKYETYHKSLKWLGLGLMGSAVALALYGCSPVTRSSYDVRTDKHKIRVFYEDTIDEKTKDGIDRLTDEVYACLEIRGYRTRRDVNNLKVGLVLDGVLADGRQFFKCDKSVSSSGMCAGYYDNGEVILVTPNLAAYTHEFVHWNGFKEEIGEAQVCE